MLFPRETLLYAIVEGQMLFPNHAVIIRVEIFTILPSPLQRNMGYKKDS